MDIDIHRYVHILILDAMLWDFLSVCGGTSEMVNGTNIVAVETNKKSSII